MRMLKKSALTFLIVISMSNLLEKYDPSSIVQLMPTTLTLCVVTVLKVKKASGRS